MFAKKVKIDCSKFTSRETVHEELQRAFKGTEYYGKNLDAFHDVLTSIRKDTKIFLKNRTQAPSSIQEYINKMIKVIRDSAEENEHLILKF